MKQFLKSIKLSWLLALILFVGFGLANGQASTTTPNPITTSSSATLLQTTQQYQASSEELLSLQESEVDKATANLEELRLLVADGLVAKVELETSEQSLAALRRQLEATRQQIADSHHTIAEIAAEEKLAQARESVPLTTTVKLSSKPYGNFSAKAVILRYQGLKSWSIGGLTGLQSYFYNAFGRALPTSAVGQSATHNRLGYDHRNAVDVALHPDTAEGRALISYLQEQGIPFLAFRTAVPGVATGPHIHVGSPSHRL